MAEPERLTVSKMLTKLRTHGCVPLGILAFDVEEEKFSTTLFTAIDPKEFQALLAKEGLRFDGNRPRQ